MSKRAYIYRYRLIIEKLKKHPFTSGEVLTEYISGHLNLFEDNDPRHDPEKNISLRTLQRDFKEISQLFGIDIAYDKKEKGYYIDATGPDETQYRRMMEAFDLFHSLHLSQKADEVVYFEKRRFMGGTEHFSGLAYAVQQRKLVQFNYYKFEDDILTQRTAEPYALKEFKNRWYLLAKDRKDDQLKTFALDRIHDLQIMHQEYVYPRNLNIEQRFQYCYGIICPDTGEPENIILSFDTYQGQYIKTLPLHHTQQVLADTEDELRISLQLFITWDFIQELLTMAGTFKVVQPEGLKEELKGVLSNGIRKMDV
jgi:predicted DNA-binding transcriptional regulator YafY